jgi:16S rRNA (adenine1518-N6/adenine1519-N6)-dimethyltransferase
MTPGVKPRSPAAVMALAREHGFRPSKSLGQNFLMDQNIADNIIEAARIGQDDLVIEIGPGMGILTAAAANLAAHVIAVEIDKFLIPILNETLSGYDNVEIINDDILKVDLLSLSRNYKNVKIIGNLPYNITSPAIMKILEEKTGADSLTVMIQKEVADRIQAPPGTKSYGAITVAINYYSDVNHISDVGRNVFVPKPNVDSTILRLDIRKSPPVWLIDEKSFFACVKSGFGKRRKTLLNSLTGIYDLDKKGAGRALSGAGIAPSRRAETLDLREFATLANHVYREAHELGEVNERN